MDLVAELVGDDGPHGPFEAEQALDGVIGADVVAADALPGVLAGPVRVPAEGERDSVRVPAQHRLEGPVAPERVPEETVERRGRLRPREAQAVIRRMMGDDDDPADPG